MVDTLACLSLTPLQLFVRPSKQLGSASAEARARPNLLTCESTTLGALPRLQSRAPFFSLTAASAAVFAPASALSVSQASLSPSLSVMISIVTSSVLHLYR